MTYDLTTPCKHCPFRHDIRPYLRLDRAEEISESLMLGSSFPCHKTTNFNDEGEHISSEKEKHCAGALIMLESLEQPNQMMRIAERLGLYDQTKLNMQAPVFNSFDEFIEAQEY